MNPARPIKPTNVALVTLQLPQSAPSATVFGSHTGELEGERVEVGGCAGRKRLTIVSSSGAFEVDDADAGHCLFLNGSVTGSGVKRDRSRVR
jgi:hypothetical protein